MKNILILMLSILSIHSVLGQSSFNMGYKEYNDDRYANAISYFTKSISVKEKVIDSYLYRGMAYLFLEDIDKSKADFDEAFRLDPNNSKVYSFYGKYYSATSQYGKALENYNIALNKNPENYALYSERAGAKSMLGMFSEAVSDAEIAVKNAPNDYNVYLNRGYIKMSLDKYEEAIEDFTKSLNIKTSHKGYGNRGTAYALLKKYDLSLKDFDQALKYNPNDPLILYYQGEVFLAIGENEKACADFLNSKKLGNNSIDDVIQKAKCNENNK